MVSSLGFPGLEHTRLDLGQSVGHWPVMPRLKLWDRPGGVVEWLMAPVLKTGEVKASAGSNPAPSVPDNPVLERVLGR